MHIAGSDISPSLSQSIRAVHEREKETQIDMKQSKFQSRAAVIRGALVAGVLAVFTTFAVWPGATAEAQAACSGATSGAAADADQQAYVDLGVGAKATFVCITSTAFTGGQSAPLTANGTVANGCFIVEGLNTSVVAVYRDSSVTSMSCAQLVRIDVGTGAAATPTATATATATTPAATATPTRTPTAPSATATQPPATATQPAATATPTRAIAPQPPATGTGSASDSGFPLLGLGIVVLALGAVGVTGFATARKGTRR